MRCIGKRKDKKMCIVLLALFLSFFTIGSTNAEDTITYKFDNSFDQNTSLTAVSPAFSTDKTVFAVSSSQLYRSTDGGNTWEQLAYNIDNTFDYDEKITISDVVYNEQGCLFLYGYRTRQNKRDTFLIQSKDSAASWDKVSFVYSYKNVTTNGREVTRIYDQRFWKSFNGGKTWQELKYFGSNSIRAYHIPDDRKSIHAICKFSNVLDADIYIDGVWEHPDFATDDRISKSKIICAGGAPGGLMILGTSNNYILVSKDYGKTWNVAADAIPSAISFISCATDGDVLKIFAAAKDGLFVFDYPMTESAKERIDQAIRKKIEESKALKKKTELKFVVGRNSYQLYNLNKTMSAEAFIEDGRVFLPLRYLAEALGANLVWSAKDQTIKISKFKTTVLLTIDKKEIKVNNTAETIDVSPIIREGRSFLPARYICEAFGYSVDWMPETNTVYIH